MKKIRVISLGDNCFARYIVTKAGIKPTKDDGELSMPFDLAVHFPRYIPWLIKHHFRGYLKGFVFNAKDNVYTVFVRKHLFGKKHYVAWLNHDTDIQGDIQKLQERYIKRIKNFYNALTANAVFLFVQNVGTPYDAHELIDVLDDMVDDYYLVLLDVTGKMTDMYNRKNVKIIHCPYPHENYIWYDSEQRNKPDGIKFENDIVKELQTFYEKIKTDNK